MNAGATRWLVAAILLAVACAAPAQDYPDKTLRLVVAYPPGGPADIAARILTEQLSTQLPQRFMVDNRPGAGGIIGTEVVANAPPDGYTLLLSGNNIAIAQGLSAAPRYDSTQSFVHVAQIATLPTGVFVSAQSPHVTFRDLVAYAKANPDKLTYASGGNGTPSHLAMEMLKRMAGIEVRHVPYKGTPPAVTDLIGGQVDMLVTSIAGPIEQVKAGRLKILAVSSPERLEQLPNVPAIAESLPGYAFETWLAISAPRGTAAAAAGRHIDVPIQDGRIAGKTDWLEGGKNRSLSPTVFLVDLPPSSMLDVHFHRENQFQLFVKGEGSIGPHAIRPLTVHYAGAYTGYGPLAAGPEGVSYFTIRPVYDTGAFYLPQARGDMVRGAKRNLQSEPIAPLAQGALRALTKPDFVDIIALQPDRVAARLLRLPPHTTHVDLDPAGSGGQFAVVITGSIALAGRELCELDMIFLSADEPALPIKARAEGAEVVLLQVPVKAEAYVGHGWSDAAQESGTEL